MGCASSEARSLCELGRAVRLNPLLSKLVSEGRITVAAGSIVAEVLADPRLLHPDDDWIGWAEREPTSALRRRVRRRKEEIALSAELVLPFEVFVSLEGSRRLRSRPRRRVATRGSVPDSRRDARDRRRPLPRHVRREPRQARGAPLPADGDGGRALRADGRAPRDLRAAGTAVRGPHVRAHDVPREGACGGARERRRPRGRQPGPALLAPPLLPRLGHHLDVGDRRGAQVPRPARARLRAALRAGRHLQMGPGNHRRRTRRPSSTLDLDPHPKRPILRAPTHRRRPRSAATVAARRLRRRRLRRSRRRSRQLLRSPHCRHRLRGHSGSGEDLGSTPSPDAGGEPPDLPPFPPIDTERFWDPPSSPFRA